MSFQTPRRLENKVALITGADSGIGRQVALRFAQHGTLPVIADIDVNGLNQVASEIRNDVLLISLDVTQRDDWQIAMSQVSRRYGAVDILVNCAGIAIPDDDIESGTDEEFQRVMDVNLVGSVYACRQFLPLLKVRGGSIINLGSIRSHVGSPDTLAYSTSKSAILGFTRSLTLYCAKKQYGIRANTICPGSIQTEMHERWIAGHSSDHVEHELTRQYPVGRLGVPDDVAWLAVYLRSDESRFVTGAHFNVDGGFTA